MLSAWVDLRWGTTACRDHWPSRLEPATGYWLETRRRDLGRLTPNRQRRRGLHSGFSNVGAFLVCVQACSRSASATAWSAYALSPVIESYAPRQIIIHAIF